MDDAIFAATAGADLTGDPVVAGADDLGGVVLASVFGAADAGFGVAAAGFDSVVGFDAAGVGFDAAVAMDLDGVSMVCVAPPAAETQAAQFRMHFPESPVNALPWHQCGSAAGLHG